MQGDIIKDTGSGFLARVMPATKILQSLTGKGRINKKKVKSAQKVIDKLKKNEDISSYLLTHIEEMQAACKKCKNQDDQNYLDELAVSLSEFKANSGMFGENNVYELPNIMLRWVECIEKVDEDVLEVLIGYTETLISLSKIKKISDKHLEAISQELEKACSRFFERNNHLKLLENFSNKNSFYLSEKIMTGKDSLEELKDDT